MKDIALSSALQVTDPRVAAVFSDPWRRQLVLLLAARDRSLVELSVDTGVDIKRLHYHVTALRGLGLIVVTREKARAGRAIKVYRASAKAFFVPARVAVKGPAHRLSIELRDSLAKAQEHTQHGMLYHLGENKEPRFHAIRQDGAAQVVAVESWRILSLSKKEAAALTSAMTECLKGFANRKAGKKINYLAHFAIAPRLNHSG